MEDEDGSLPAVKNNQPIFKTHRDLLRYITLSIFIISFSFVGVYTLNGGHAASSIVGSITDFTDPAFLLNLPFGTRSFYDQPSRAYMNTVPATTLLNAVGINYDAGTGAAGGSAQVTQVDHLLADSGFKHIRMVITWGSMDPQNPTQLSANQLAKINQDVSAMKANGIRPLITLEAYDENPVPNVTIKNALAATPKVGDTTVKVTPGAASQIIPGRTGITQNGNTAGILFTAVKGDTVTLSRPITKQTDLSGKITIMSYAPFQKPFLADGTTPNPAFTATMNGWLAYVKAVATAAKNALGSDQFDLEIWNELVAQHSFLSTTAYYSKSPDANDTGEAKQQILAQTAAFIKSPANGFSDVNITDGFASQTPFVSGANLPAGAEAISKHYYPIAQKVYPQDLKQDSIKPLNALLQPGYTKKSAPFVDTFVPSYVAHFPESWLSALTTETEVRDMSPITNNIYNAPHGVNVLNQGGQPTQVWETEWNQGVTSDPQGLQPVGGTNKKGKGTWPTGDRQYIQAKADMRYLSSYVNKGLSQVDFFSATANGDLGIVDPGFLSDVSQNPTIYPGDAAGGEITQVLQRFIGSFSAAKNISKPRSLSLDRLDDYSGGIQFKGNGTAQYPDLYDRDVFGFFPYQVTNNNFIIPIYIQTEDIEKIYNANAPGFSKFDLPAETYGLTIGGVNGNQVNSISLYDPLTGATPAVTVTARSDTSITVQVPVTDSPRLLSITDCTTSCNSKPPKVQPPTVDITAPVSGTIINGQTLIEATATADPTRSVASVQFYINGSAVGPLQTAAPYSYKWKAQSVSNGTYTISAVVQDSSGEQATSNTVTVTVVNGVMSPTVTIISPADKSSVSGTVSLQATATSDSSTTVASVQFQIDGKSVGPPITKAPYTFMWNSKLVSNSGKHNLLAIVTDGDGNTAKSHTTTLYVRN